MNYWILALPRTDMETCMNTGIFGMSYPYLLGRVQINDKIICCASKEWKVIGLGHVTRPHHVGHSKIFNKNGDFPERIGFVADPLQSHEELDFRKIIPRLSFIATPEKWGPYFMHPIRQIAREDWQLIKACIGR